jgi:O-antigen/teichoic acid export membrane protein
MSGICILVTIASQPIVLLLSTSSYIDAGAVVGFITMGTIWYGATTIVDAAISKTGRTYWSSIGTGVGWLVHFITMLAAVRYFGITAAGIAYLAGSIVTFVVILLAAQRLWYFPYDKYVILIVLIISISSGVINFYTYPANVYSFVDMRVIMENMVVKAVPLGTAWLMLVYYVCRNEDVGAFFRSLPIFSVGKSSA